MFKNIFMAVTAVFAAFLMTASCTKTGVSRYEGYYSFKTGGYVDLKGKVYDIKTDTVSVDTTIRDITIGGIAFKDTVLNYNTRLDTLGSRDTSFTRHLNSESGQMHILKESDSKAVVTMNVTAGDPYVFLADVEGDFLTLVPLMRRVSFSDSSSDQNSMFKVGGKARRLDDVVLIDMELEGEYKMTGVDAGIVSSSVNCIASLNR